jgi:uncharacterized protein with HEPN domain/predicted nucleotidyltransferase
METAKPAAIRSVSWILQHLTAAIPDLRRKFKVARVGVFGSYARGHQRAGSDLDVLVEFASKWRYDDLFGLQEELNALLGMKVDVVPREALKPYVGKRILADVVWLDEPDGRRALATIRERPPSPKPEREIRDFLHDILENIEFLRGFVASGDFDLLMSDRPYQYAFLHALFIIGEATTRVAPETRSRYPDIPWTRIVGLRNVIAHNYPDLSLETIWEVAQNELEAFNSVVTEILAEIDRRERQD